MDFNGKAKDALVRFNLGLYCQFCEDAIAIWRKIAASQLKVGCNQFGKCNFAALWWSKWYSSQTIFTFSSAHFFTSAPLKSKLKWILTLQLHPYLIEYNLYNFVHLTGHPLLQATYTGVRTTVPSFLAKTKREQPLPGHIHCEIWPRSLRLWLWILRKQLSKDKALVQKHLKSLTGFELPIILGVKFWWFSFFLLPL